MCSHVCNPFIHAPVSSAGQNKTTWPCKAFINPMWHFEKQDFSEKLDYFFILRLPCSLSSFGCGSFFLLLREPPWTKQCARGESINIYMKTQGRCLTYDKWSVFLTLLQMEQWGWKSAKYCPLAHSSRA